MFVVVAVDDRTKRAHIDRLRRAIELAGLTEQQACAEMEITQAQWSQQCQGHGHLSYTRLVRLPPEVLSWLAVLTARDYGLPLEIAHGAQLARLVHLRKRAETRERQTA